MHYELSIFRMFFHGKIQSYKGCKDFHLYDKFYFPQLIQDPNPIAKKTIAKRSEFSLIRKNKTAMLSFMPLGMDLVIMSD